MHFCLGFETKIDQKYSFFFVEKYKKKDRLKFSQHKPTIIIITNIVVEFHENGITNLVRIRRFFIPKSCGF